MGVIRNVISTFLLIVFLSGSALAADISALRISQAKANLPEIKVFLDILDGEGKPVSDVQTTQLTGTVGNTPVTITELKPFEKTEEGIAYILLVDISKSLTNKQFDQMRKALSIWVEKMRDKDRAAVITFGETVTVTQDYSADKAVLKKTIESLIIKDNKTQLHQGIARAIELGKRLDAGLPSRRAIIMLSDGEDDFAGGMTQQEVLDRMKEDRVPIYAIGFANKSKTADVNLKKLGEFARYSGGEFFQADSTVNLQNIYDLIQNKITKSMLAKVNCQGVASDGKVYRLQLTLNLATKTITDGIDLRFISTVPAKKHQQNSWWQMIPWWGYAGGGTVLIAIMTWVIKIKRRRRQERFAAIEELRKKEGEKKKKHEDEQKKGQATAKPAGTAGNAAISPPAGIRIKLTAMGSTEPGRNYNLHLIDRAVIGRSSASDLALGFDQEISSRQCELSFDNNVVMISDLGSTNGTYVNGVPISGRYCLSSGDLIMLGRTEFRITF